MTFKCPSCGFQWGKINITYVKYCLCRRCQAAGKNYEPRSDLNKHVPLTVADMKE